MDGREGVNREDCPKDSGRYECFRSEMQILRIMWKYSFTLGSPWFPYIYCLINIVTSYQCMSKYVMTWLSQTAGLLGTKNTGQNKSGWKIPAVQLPTKSGTALICSWLFGLLSWWIMKLIFFSCVAMENSQFSQVITSYWLPYQRLKKKKVLLNLRRGTAEQGIGC